MCRGNIDFAVLVSLVEKSRHLITLLELGHLRTDLDDLAGPVGSRNDRELSREWVLALFNDD
jgi:hypothetical protein